MSTIAQTSPATHISGIDVLARRYSDARAVVSGRVDIYKEELRALQKRHVPGIKQAAGVAAQRQAELQAEIAQHPELFVQPRTMTLHGIKLGFLKGKGKIIWSDDEKLIARIRDNAGELSVSINALIVKTEAVSKEGLAKLTAQELKKLGVSVVDGQDAVFIKAADSDVEKLVAQLLEEGAKEE